MGDLKKEFEEKFWHTKHKTFDKFMVSLWNWIEGKIKETRLCEWSEFDDGIFTTTCEKSYQLTNDFTLKENEMKYCPFCGGVISELKKLENKNE